MTNTDERNECTGQNNTKRNLIKKKQKQKINFKKDTKNKMN